MTATTRDRIVTDEIIPALEAEPGFSGALNLVDGDMWEVNARA